MNATPNKRSLRIVFMGTPDFAVAGLDALVKAGYDVVGVITAPDRPAGRGRQLKASAVKTYALEQGLEILQPTNLKDASFLADLKALRANLQIVVAFRMLPRAVWQMPEYGTFNLHASLLPQYRGAAPINWAIINGETRTGVTTFFIDDKIDTGAIILQKETPIAPEETAGELHDRLMHQGAELILETAALIAKDTVTLKTQADATQLKPAHKLYKDTCKIDWGSSLQDIHNFIRGLSPYPGAWSTLMNNDQAMVIKIHKAAMDTTLSNQPLGTVLKDKDGLSVVVKDGVLKLLQIQLPGKRSMAIKDVLNGLSIADDAYIR